MKIHQINDTYIGINDSFSDISFYIKHNGELKLFLVRNIPFFDKDGSCIGYDEALEIYGEDGLADSIWDDDNYIKFIEKYIENHGRELESLSEKVLKF